MLTYMTGILFSLSAKENANIKIKKDSKIYYLLGQEIRTLVNGTPSAGLQTVHWNGKNSRGQAVSSGVYFYRLETPAFTKTMKMVMIR